MNLGGTWKDRIVDTRGGNEVPPLGGWPSLAYWEQRSEGAWASGCVLDASLGRPFTRRRPQGRIRTRWWGRGPQLTWEHLGTSPEELERRCPGWGRPGRLCLNCCLRGPGPGRVLHMGQGRVHTHRRAPIWRFSTLLKGTLALKVSWCILLLSTSFLELRPLHFSAQSPTNCAGTKPEHDGGTTLPIYPWNTRLTSQCCWRRCRERIPCSTVWITGKQSGSRPHSDGSASLLNSDCVARNETEKQKNYVTNVLSSRAISAT